MQEFLKMDVFFVVTTFAVVLVSVGLVVVLIYVIRILKDMKILSTKAKDEGERILEDVSAFREETEKKGASLSKLFSFFFPFFGFSKKRKSKNRDSDID
jgi:hypothetical protein